MGAGNIEIITRGSRESRPDLAADHLFHRPCEGNVQDGGLLRLDFTNRQRSSEQPAHQQHVTARHWKVDHPA